MHYVKYLSINNADVTGLFTIPKMASKPVPVIIFLHGIGDYKDRDYMEQGHQFMVDSSYAVFRIDAANHGARKVHDYEYDIVKNIVDISPLIPIFYTFYTLFENILTIFSLRSCWQTILESLRIGIVEQNKEGIFTRNFIPPIVLMTIKK